MEAQLGGRLGLLGLLDDGFDAVELPLIFVAELVLFEGGPRLLSREGLRWKLTDIRLPLFGAGPSDAGPSEAGSD